MEWHDEPFNAPACLYVCTGEASQTFKFYQCLPELKSKPGHLSQKWVDSDRTNIEIDFSVVV